MLAGDLYGIEEKPENVDRSETLVLSSVHQAKGLEWSRVVVIRLVENSFPNIRGLSESDGEDEERRIFYVAITRAMDELVLTHPLTTTRGPWEGYTFARRSRFVEEIPRALYEP